jgi:hypothetical protein
MKVLPVPPPKPAIAAAAAPVKPAATVPRKPSATAVPAPAPAPAPPATTGEGDAAQEALLDEANDVNRLFSNDVLEWEKLRVTKLIAAAKAAKKPIPEDLPDRLQVVDMKMSMLVVQVQTGKLSPEKYTEVLKKSLESEKGLAKRLVGAGLREEAKLALARAKIIEAEIAAGNE